MKKILLILVLVVGLFGNDEKEFIMILNKDNNLCSNMLDIYNDKDKLLSHKEFNTYKYDQEYSVYRAGSKSRREKRESRIAKEGMIIDVNNDGKKESLLRNCSVKYNAIVRLSCYWDIVPYKYHQNLIDGMDAGVLKKDTIKSFGSFNSYQTQIQDINKTSIELLPKFTKNRILKEQQNNNRIDLSSGTSIGSFMPFIFNTKNYFSFNSGFFKTEDYLSFFSGFIDISEMNKEYQLSTKCIFYKKGEIDGN